MKCRMISEENGKVERRSEELATLLTPWTSPSRGKCPTARAGYLSLRRAHWRPMQQPPRSFRYRYSYQQQWSLLIVRQLSAASSEAIHSTALNSLSLFLSLYGDSVSDVSASVPLRDDTLSPTLTRAHLSLSLSLSLLHFVYISKEDNWCN